MSSLRESTSSFLRRHPIGHTEFLFQRAGEGSERAWGAILDRYYSRLRLEVNVRVPAHLRRFFDKDDVLSEAFQRAWSKRRSFRYVSEPAFRRWLSLLISRELLSMIRKRGHELWHRTSESQVGGMESAMARGDEERGVDDRELFLGAMHGLTARERDLISMHQVEHMTFDAMAELLGVSPQQACKRYTRAYERLEHRLRTLRGRDEGSG